MCTNESDVYGCSTTRYVHHVCHVHEIHVYHGTVDISMKYSIVCAPMDPCCSFQGHSVVLVLWSLFSLTILTNKTIIIVDYTCTTE